MAQLEDLTKGGLVRRVLAEGAVRVVDVDWHGSDAVTPLHVAPDHQLLTKDMIEAALGPPRRPRQASRARSMDGPGRSAWLWTSAHRPARSPQAAQGGDEAPEVRYLHHAFDDVGGLPFDSIGVTFKWQPYFGRGRVPA